jgi:hypothetical protein
MKLPSAIVGKLDKLVVESNLRINWVKYPDVDEILKKYYSMTDKKKLIAIIKELHPELKLTMDSLYNRWQHIKGSMT